MIPLWAISAIGAGAVAGLAGYGLASRLGDAKLARAEAGWAQERTSAMKQSLQQAEKFLARAQEDAENLAKVESDAHAKIVAALADRDSAVATQRSLRDTTTRALDALRRGTTEAPATAAECAATDSAARVFADLFGRADEAAGVLAEYGDAARIAGDACVAADQVTR